MDIRIFIAGAAGEGIQTIGSLLARVIQAQGYSVFSWQEFESRIRGGQNSYRLRVSETPLNAPTGKADILLSMNPGASQKYLPLLDDKGILLAAASAGYDNEIMIPFVEIAREDYGKGIYANTVAIGAVCGMLGIKDSQLANIIQETFAQKEAAIIRTNQEAAEKGYMLARDACIDKCPWQLNPNQGRYYLIPGHEAVALGAVCAGCRFISAYPMSPSTDIITWLNRNEKRFGIFCEQAEDEIAAINMAIGAGFAGARAMTATSGGGFALMTEGVSLAGMTETPVVIVLAQRPGPATGLPTRTAQGDLLFAINAGHGEFPKLVLAPADAQDAFRKTIEAFNLGEKYQIPVIILTDQFLADSQFSYEAFDVKGTPPDFHLPDPDAIEEYRRYDRSVESGVSPRLVPGQSRHLVGADSDEHDEHGHITEDLGNMAPQMLQKRLKKMAGLKAEIAPPEQRSLESADIVLVGWGTSRDAMLESLDKLKAKRIEAGMIHFTYLWPMPDFEFPTGKRYLAVESNATGQLEWLLKAQYGMAMDDHIRRYDGLPLTAKDIIERVA